MNDNKIKLIGWAVSITQITTEELITPDTLHEVKRYQGIKHA